MVTMISSSSYQGRFPVSISNKTHPRLQISALTLYPSFWWQMTSGAIQGSIRCTLVNGSLCILSSLVENSRSESLQLPSLSSRTLSAFRFWPKLMRIFQTFQIGRIGHIPGRLFVANGGISNLEVFGAWKISRHPRWTCPFHEDNSLMHFPTRTP